MPRQCGEEPKALRRIARKLQHCRGCQREGGSLRRHGRDGGAPAVGDPGQQERADLHAIDKRVRRQLRGVEFDLAMPVQFRVVEVGRRDAGTPQAVQILLEHLEHRMGDHALTVLDNDIVVADAVEADEQSGQRRSRLSRAAGADDEGSVAIEAERRGVRKPPAGRGLGPVNEQTQRRSVLPRRDVHRAREGVDADGGGGIVELPRRCVVVIEAAPVPRRQDAFELPRRKSGSLVPGGRRIPTFGPCVQREYFGGWLESRGAIVLDKHRLAVIRQPPAGEPDRHVEPCQPQVPPDQRLAREHARRRDAVIGVGEEIARRHDRREACQPGLLLRDHSAGRGVGHPACSSTSWIGSAKMSSARSSNTSMRGGSPAQASVTTPEKADPLPSC